MDYIFGLFLTFNLIIFYLKFMKPLKIFNNQFILKKQITSNKFGVVFLGLDSNSRGEVVLKI